VELKPEFPEALNNLGAALQERASSTPPSKCSAAG
jgi:hypothetical protein